MISREEVLTWLTGWLAKNTDKQVGLSDVPSTTPTLPYVVVDLLPSPTPTGAWADPETDHELVLQIKSVGASPEQAMWMSDLVRSVLTERDTNGTYLYSAEGQQGFTVSNRSTSSPGSIVKSGDRLFEVPDTYRIEVVQ
jgi:hypothetical protein